MHMLAFTLVVVGGLNWGLVGIIDLNLVEVLLGSVPLLEKSVYVLVALSAVYLVVMHKKECRICGEGAQMKMEDMGSEQPVM